MLFQCCNWNFDILFQRTLVKSLDKYNILFVEESHSKTLQLRLYFDVLPIFYQKKFNKVFFSSYGLFWISQVLLHVNLQMYQAKTQSFMEVEMFMYYPWCKYSSKNYFLGTRFTNIELVMWYIFPFKLITVGLNLILGVFCWGESEFVPTNSWLLLSSLVIHFSLALNG